MPRPLDYFGVEQQAANAVYSGRQSMKNSSLRILLFLLTVVVLPAQAASRVLDIIAPTEVTPGSQVSVTIVASKDAGDGEQVGFVHADYSNDDGKTWTKFCYAEKSGAEFSRQISFPAGAKGVKSIVRARVAFRGGKAGDVDFKGGAIQWGDTWEKWRTPPTKFAIIYVTGR
jgi:hypothetical protein